MHNLESPSKTSLLGTVTAIYDVGCCLGSILAYWLGERLGRKNTVLLGTTVMSIGAILQASSYSVGHMMTGRVIAGIGNGNHSHHGSLHDALTNLTLSFRTQYINRTYLAGRNIQSALARKTGHS